MDMNTYRLIYKVALVVVSDRSRGITYFRDAGEGALTVVFLARYVLQVLLANRISDVRVPSLRDV